MVDTAGENVVEGVVSGVGIGEWLEEERLQPKDIAILVTKVFKPETVVYEVLKDIMGECLHSTIRWPQRHVWGTERFAIENVEDAVRVFDFSKDHQGLNIRHHVLRKKAVVKWTAKTLPSTF